MTRKEAIDVLVSLAAILDGETKHDIYSDKEVNEAINIAIGTLIALEKLKEVKSTC